HLRTSASSVVPQTYVTENTDGFWLEIHRAFFDL
ncbi:Unannotated, partial [Lentimonas sp. CC6]